MSALESSGLSVLYDDRPIGAGAKFADADLIGCPLRVTISSRSLQAGGAELAGRKGSNSLKRTGKPFAPCRIITPITKTKPSSTCVSCTMPWTNASTRRVD